MTKHDFLQRLREDVSILSEAEQEDILTEYQQHLEMKIASGMTEEEATGDFEPYEEFIANLLEAYHINPHYQEENRQGEDRSRLGDSLRQAGLFLQECLDTLLSLTSREFGYVFSRFFMLGIVTLVILILPKFIFGISLGIIIPYNIRQIFSGVTNLVYGIFVLAFVSYAIYYGLSRYLLPLRSHDNFQAHKRESTSSEKSAEKASQSHATHRQERRSQKTMSHDTPSAPREDNLGRIFMIIAKLVLLLVFFIPLIFFIVSIIIGTGASLVGSILGFPLIGVTLMGMGATLLGILLFIAVWRVTFMEVK